MKLDIGDYNPPTEHDIIWAWKLWNSLRLPDASFGGGVWDMPTVGRYIRTGEAQLTLTEIHGQQDSEMWNKHDWIILLGQALDWEIITDKVEIIDTEPHHPDMANPKLEDIGKVHACPCGMTYTLLGANTGELRLMVNEEGNCLNPICNIVIPKPFAGVLSVANDAAVIAKAEAQEMLFISQDEDETPLPIEIVFPVVSEEE
mgnify:CR=1 FL=1|jgi:hypothetical protein